MKKLAIIPLLLLFTLFVQGQKAKATFFSEDGYKFWVVIDGAKKNADANYRVENIEVEGEWAKVKIIFEDPKLEPIDKTIQTRDAEGKVANVTWVIKQTGKGKWVVRASSWQTDGKTGTEDQPAETGQEVQVEQPENNGAGQTGQTVQQTNTTVTTSEQPTGQNSNMNISINTGQENQGVNFNLSTNIPGMPAGTSQSTTTQTTTTTTTQTMTVNHPPSPGKAENKPVEKQAPQGCTQPMDNAAFNTAKNSISSKSFEDSKLTLAKQVAGSNCLSATQVKEIIGLFSFEDNRLEFAKFAYQKTVDKGNYYLVNDAFTFESTIEELNEYISSQK